VAGVGGHDYEIFLYDGMGTVQLTNNDHDDEYPRIYSSNVVWIGGDGHDCEIFLYDGSTITQITDNDEDDKFAQVYGSNVIWYGWDGNDTEIFLFDGSDTIQLTDNDYDDKLERYPQISAEMIVWFGQVGGAGNDWEIFVAVPEPATVGLMAMGLVGVFVARKRKKLHR